MPRYDRPRYKSLADAIAGEVGVWMRETTGAGRYAIVNPDIDGLLTFCILKEQDPSIRFGGFYLDEYRMLLTPEANDLRQSTQQEQNRTRHFLSVENDLLIMDSIGQHFCILDDPRFAKINPNALRYGSGREPGARELLDAHFGRKYPFSTAFFIWSIFHAGEPLTDSQLLALLYPDSAIVKQFIVKYRSNAESWLTWLGQAAITDQFFGLAGSDGVAQVARCFFKHIRVTQPAATFDIETAEPRVNNGAVIQRILDYFCSLLGIPTQTIYTGPLVAGRQYHYRRINAARQPTLPARTEIFFRWLATALRGGSQVAHSDDEGSVVTRHVVSEAMVTFGEWSVTTDQHWQPPGEPGILTTTTVVVGRNREHDSHISALNLRSPCQPGPFGCVWSECAAGPSRS